MLMAMVDKIPYPASDSGGCDPTSLTPHRPLASVFAISTEPGHNWQRMAAMDEARMLHCACVTGNKIYVFGGIGDTER